MATVIVLSAVVERLQHCFTVDSFYSQLITDDVKSSLDRLWGLLNDDEAIDKHMQDENFAKQVCQLEKTLYEIEYLVESHEVPVASINPIRKMSSAIPEMLRERQDKQNFRAKLKILTNQINDIPIRQVKAVRSQETSQGSSSSRDNVGGPSLPRSSTMVGEQWDGEHIIRMEHHEKKLLSDLTGGSRRVEVVSICGVGGIGKTTLANTLYSNPIVREHFHVSVWVTVTSEFQTRDIFLGILSQTRRLESDLLARTDDMVLAEEVYTCLERQRWLVVLDDVCSIDVWESIKIVFPDGQNGSRILVTTREENVASSMSGEGYIHYMDVLNEDQSWELFKRRAQLTGSKLVSEQEQTAREILKQSGGLPLAIVVLAGILKSTSPDQWKSLLREFEGSKTPASKVTGPMDLIYNGLPSVLKPCLLYMGTFPEGSKIEVDTMCQLWIAEGLVSEKQRSTNSKTTMEIAEDNFYKLASRNLVQVSEEEMSTHQSFRYGCLHDLIRDICISKAKEEEFFEVVNLGHAHQPKGSVYRCAIYLDKHEKMEIHPYLRSDLRSLLFFSTYHQSGEELIRLSAIPDLSTLKGIRILHFDGVDFRGGKLPPGVENLVLRYLSLRNCYLEKLPPYVSKFLFLITLDIRVKKWCKVIIPNVLCKLQKLRHLYLPLKFQTPNHDKLRFNDMTELEILENFDAVMCNAEDIPNLRKLRHLAVSSEGNLQDLNPIFTCIKQNTNHWRKTSLDIRNFESYTKERLDFIKELFSCHVLHILRLEGHIGKMQKLDAARASFIEIYLNGSELEDDPMQILDGLPNLRILVLEREAYIGEEMRCSDGFPELRSLKLSNLYNLESWEMKRDAMPKLSTLTIENCRKMKKLPEELGRINKLRKVKINMMSKEFVDMLRKVVDGNGGENPDKINTNCTIEYEDRLLKRDFWQQKRSLESKMAECQIPSSSGTPDLASSSACPPPKE